MVERVGENASRGESRYGCPVRPPIPLVVEAAAARAAGALSRLAGRGGGTTLPGKLLWKVDPAAIDRLAARLPQGTVLVSATNGKTTTTAMAAEILRPRVRLATNGSGANLVFGLDDPRHARAELQHAADSKYCLRCGAPYTYAAAYVGHLGDYMCPNGDHARPPLDIAARDIELRGLEGSSFTLSTSAGDARVELVLPGL